MPFDLNTAIPVDDKETGLAETPKGFDLSSAVPVINPLDEELSTGKDTGYKPPLTEEQKAQAVVELSYKEKGEVVPPGLKAEWLLSSPAAKLVTTNTLGGILTGGVVPAYNALKGIANTASPNSDIGKMVFDSAYKGLAESQAVDNLGGAAAKAYPEAPWVVSGSLGAVAEMLMFAPGVFKAGANLVSKDTLFLNSLNELRQSPKYNDLISAISQKTNIPIQEVDSQLFRKLWDVRDDASYLKLLNANLKQATGIDILSESGSIPVRRPSIGEVAQFTDEKGIVKTGIIKDITGERAIIDMNGRNVVAMMSQLSPMEKPEQPSAGGMIHEVPEQMKKWMEKGVTITERQVPIRITDPEAQIKDVSGNIVDLPKGHEMTPYKLSNGKIWLHDGKNIIVDSGQLTNLANKNLVLGEKAISPEETQIEEVIKGEVVKDLSEQNINKVMQKYNLNQNQAVEMINSGKIKTGETKFSQYQLPGGENYKEVLIKAPLKPQEGKYTAELLDDGRYRVYKNGNSIGNSVVEAKNEEEAIQKVKQNHLEKGFKSSHWDEPNVLAHYRINDRTTPDGKKVLFVEEIQSDWAREGRSEGFQGNLEKQKELDNVIKRIAQLKEIMSQSQNKFLKYINEWNNAISKRDELQTQINTGVSFHPLLKNWQELALKNILKKAIEGGYDYISWTTGEQQAHRYDLSEQIDKISYQKDGDYYYVSAMKDNRGIPLANGNPIKGEELEKWVGKQIAEKIIKGEGKSVNYAAANKPDNVYTELTGVDLKIGGEWAKNLYDKQIPNIFKDMTKGTIENIKIPEMSVDGSGIYSPYQEGWLSQPALKITPEIKAKVIAQPMAGGLPIQPIKPRIDLSNLPQLQKQIDAMEDRQEKLEISQDALNKINTVRSAFRHRISKYSGKFLKEELAEIPSIYITRQGGIKPDEALEELRARFNIDLQDESALKDYLKELERTKKSLETDIEAVKPGFITKRETTILKEKIKSVEMGYRAGTVKTKEAIKNLQSDFISTIEDLDVPTSDKWRIIKVLKNVQTPKQFSTILNHVTEQLENLQNKSERMKLVNNIKKVFSKQPTQNLPLHYKDQIEAIMAKIDPRQRAPSTKRKIESLRNFIKRMQDEGEDINIPDYKLDLLEKTSLDELDMAELQALKESIEQLYHQGKVYNRLFTDKKEREFDVIKQKIVKEITGKEGLSEDSSFIKAIRENNKSLKGATLDTIKNFLYANLRPELMIKILGKEATDVIFKPLNKSDTAEISEGEKHTKKIWDTQASINVPQAYVKKYKVGPYDNITKNNALFIYANSQNEAQLEHLYASGITDEDITLFSNFLTPEERKAVEKLWEYYDKGQWPRLDEIYAKINGVHMAKEENYFPIMNLENPSETYSKELESEMMKRFRLKQAGVSKGFTKERLGSKKAFSSFDYFGTIIKNHEMVEHYIAYAEAIRDVNKVMRNPDVRAAIEQEHGKEYLRIMDNWLKDVAYGGDRTISNMLDKFARYFTSNYVTAVLGYNVLSASKSLVSFFTGVDKVGGLEVTNALGKFMFHPAKWTQFVYSKSDMMKHRDFTQEKEFKEILAGRNKYLGQAKMWQKFKEWSSTPMMLSDKVTVIPLWMSAYYDVIHKGDILTNSNLEQEAIEAADTLIRRTQPVGRPVHLPETFRGGAFQKAYTLFTNQLNQNFNREYEQTKDFLDKRIKLTEWLRTQFYLIFVSGLLIGMIQRRRFPRPKEMIYDSISQFSSGVFLLGNVADSIAMALLTKQKTDIGKAMMPKSFAALSELGYAATAKTGRGRMKHAAAAAGALTGFPYIQVGRAIDTLKDAYDLLGENMGQ